MSISTGRPTVQCPIYKRQVSSWDAVSLLPLQLFGQSDLWKESEFKLDLPKIYLVYLVGEKLWGQFSDPSTSEDSFNYHNKVMIQLLMCWILKLNFSSTILFNYCSQKWQDLDQEGPWLITTQKWRISKTTWSQSWKRWPEMIELSRIIVHSGC